MRKPHDPVVGRERTESTKRRVRRIAFAGVAAVTTTTAITAPASPVSAGGTTKVVSVDTGTMSAISRITGAQAMWDAGFTGAGIGVAVIDTGVSRVPGLDQPGKVIDGPDLSFDSQNPDLAHTDAFGHGTHIAGIIAGTDVAPTSSTRGCSTCTGLSPYTDTTKFVGIAPQAKIINVKAGAADGSVDITQIIAAIDWIVQHRNDPGLNIRVLNLSFGTDSVQPADIDPLAFAIEQAWAAGIVVVAASGNEGYTPGPMANPAFSPTIIAVGATDPSRSLVTDDDMVAPFAQHGTLERGVDVSAPGVSVRSLRVLDSLVDLNITTGKEGDRFQRASGTSQSSAIVAGLAALLLSKLPGLTPNEVKGLLTGMASPVKIDEKNKKEYVGTGSASLVKVPKTSLVDLMATARKYVPPSTTSTGTGSLEGARGDFRVTAQGVPLTGEIDIFGRPWDGAAIAAATRSQAAWSGGVFNGSQWTSDTWTNGSWKAITWTGTDWTGAKFKVADGETASEWSGARWSGARWSGARWSGARWSGARWSGARWSEFTWE